MGNRINTSIALDAETRALLDRMVAEEERSASCVGRRLIRQAGREQAEPNPSTPPPFAPQIWGVGGLGKGRFVRYSGDTSMYP